MYINTDMLKNNNANDKSTTKLPNLNLKLKSKLNII